MFRIGWIVFFASVATLAAADPHPVPEPLKQAPPAAFECRWADEAPRVDGDPGDPAWKHAETISAFHLPDRKSVV